MQKIFSNRVYFASGRALTALMFCLFALMAGLVGTFVNPPFQSPDEPAHFLRAIQVSQGGMRGIMDGGQSGGRVPSTVLPILGIFNDLPFHPEHQASAERIDKVAAVGWSGAPTTAGFPNTVTYGPVCYAPQALGILIGRAFHMSIIHTFYVARLANALFFAIIGSLAIALCCRGRGLLLLLLCLPMSLYLGASLSQDGPLIAITALLAALLTRHNLHNPWTWTHWALMGVGFGITGMAKPPELALSVVACLIVGRRELPRALLCPVIATAMTFVWLKLGVAPVKIQFLADQGVSDPGQMHYLITHPLMLPVLIERSLSAFGGGYDTQFIGVMGWLDTQMPKWFYQTAWWLLIGSFAASLLQGRYSFERKVVLDVLPRRVGIAGLILLAMTGIFMSLYIIWTKVGAPIIDGVQGRYFLPAACFTILLLPRHRIWQRVSTTILAESAIVLSAGLWMCITLVVYAHALAARFW